MDIQKADEKEHTISWRRKNVQKRTNADEKRILSKFTFSFRSNVYWPVGRAVTPLALERKV